MTVGLVYEYDFAPETKLTGTKNDAIMFSENEWNNFDIV